MGILCKTVKLKIIMLKRIGLWVVVGVSLVLAGCVVPSVYPFYTDSQVVFDGTLVGAWVKIGGNGTNAWTFEKSGDKEYKLVISDEKGPYEYSTHLFKFDSQTFMDCVPAQKVSGDLPGIPSHYLLKVEQIQPVLKWSTLNYKWVSEFLEKNPGAVPHTVAYANPDDTNSEYVILTAETKELQKFVHKHLDNTNMFTDLDDMKRVAVKEAH
jgi:hypothetical protein